jgi:hypothetical protein
MAGKPPGSNLDKVIADARRSADQRALGYRERALGMYPWICGRCAREFTRANLHELTVHHRNHNHDDNPADGSNWELLCLYCHDNEHSRQLDHAAGSLTGGDAPAAAATSNPFANLKSLLKRD